MSGIVGIVHFDRAPVDREQLHELTESMAFRGPDGRQVWLDGSVGLGCAHFATTEESLGERQPLSLDGDIWIVADARIDAREELVAELRAAGTEPVPSAAGREVTDVELILYAYRAWGEDAVNHLLGDYSFGIWDPRRRRLFAARDHLGVKPFYYVEWPGGVAFSNTLACLRRHPRVSSELDELAVADFLLFESNLEPEATTFADVRRLPPAHSRTWSPEGAGAKRYWRLPVGDVPVAESEGGWVERFSALLDRAVADRLRTDRVAVFMSGGLDSTAVAACAHRLFTARGGDPNIGCYTLGYDRLIPDREGHFAELVAKRLALPTRYTALDDYVLSERWGELPVPPEPDYHLLDAVYHDLGKAVSADYRVELTGYGGDPLLQPLPDFFVDQLKQARFGSAMRYLLSAPRWKRRIPSLGIQTRWYRRRLKRDWRSGFPSWFDRDFERRLGLLERWRWYQLERGPEVPHRTRRGAHQSLWDVTWTWLFEHLDAGARGLPVEKRYPFFDVRLVEFSLTLPPVPWCMEKHILRESMRGLLPEPVRTRPKSPLAGEPEHPLPKPESQLFEGLVLQAPEIRRFVCPRKIGDELGRIESAGAVVPFRGELHRSLNLAYWLSRSIGI
ncbi:MAG: asparagine synthetase B [bacterium]|nr:asparagine synthetase B [bacterium]